MGWAVAVYGGGETLDVRFEGIDLEKRYRCSGNDGVHALRGVTLRIFEGVIGALHGPSGAGKSTLARILMRLERADSGRILYRGRPVRETPLREFRCRNQVMFQNPHLSVNPRHSVGRILAEPLVVNGRTRAQITRETAYWRDVFSIPDKWLKRRPEELSGGELQRVVLARALVLSPDFVVLDEPFSSLDEPSAFRLLHLLKAFMVTSRTGTLYISHHLSRIRFFADALVVLNHGRVVYDGPVDGYA